jgi:hypothetical protein
MTADVLQSLIIAGVGWAIGLAVVITACIKWCSEPFVPSQTFIPSPDAAAELYRPKVDFATAWFIATLAEFKEIERVAALRYEEQAAASQAASDARVAHLRAQVGA